MKIGALLSKISKDLYLRSYQNTKPQRLASSITQHQPWRSRWCSISTDVPNTDGNRAQQYFTDVTESVKVTSREMIKPSSPTPNHIKSVYFSLIDQIAPCLYNSIVLFYQNDPHNQSFNTIEKRLKLLKQSLSDVLVDFYPLAGRIHKNELIECNNEGVEFCEANISDENLTQFIKNPSVKDLEALLPFTGNDPRHKNIVLSVQVNHFGCGGMAIGVCVTHKITDGVALTDFLKAWFTKTRDSNHIGSPPNFNSASLFPPSKEFNDITPNPPVNEEKLGIRRLIFDKNRINEMKVEASTCADDKNIVRPTTNEVVIAFIWKLLPTLTSVTQVLNLRTKMVPPIPVNSTGNFAYYSVASSSSSSSTSSIIDELRKSVRKVNTDYIKDIMFNDKSLMKLKTAIYETYGMPENRLYFTNISKFSVYEASDFGMGKPIWACLPFAFIKNISLVMSSPCGEGVEVWICMLEDDIAMLDHSLSHLASPVVKRVSVD